MKRAEVITKRIRSPTALRKVFRPDIYFSVRQNLIYSSYRTRGRKYQPTPHIDRKKRQRSKDYEPQKRVTLVQRKPVPCFSKILSKGQCRASFAGAGGRSLRWRRQTRLDYTHPKAGTLTQRHERLNRNQSPKSRVSVNSASTALPTEAPVPGACRIAPALTPGSTNPKRAGATFPYQ